MGDTGRGITMNERSGPGPTDTTDSFAWCAWHKAFSNTARLIQVGEQGSGPGHALFACSSCRDVYHLIPLADRP